MNKQKIIIILGPTASGKTSLAVNLAKQFNGEIISADSRQVYIGMDLGSGKEGERTVIDLPEIGKQSARSIDDIPQFLVDIISPKEIYTVSDFVKQSTLLIKNMQSRAKIPFIVGGTNMYIQALVDGYNIPVSDENELKIRSDLEKLPLSELLDKLKIADPEYFQLVDQKNPRRVARALSVTLASGQKFSQLRQKKEPEYDILYLALDIDRQILYENIDKRVDDRIALGMIEEVKNLLEQGILKERLISFGLEYRFISQYISGDLADQDDMLQKLKYATHAYARRQLTWLRNKLPVIWVKDIDQAKIHVEQFLVK